MGYKENLKNNIKDDDNHPMNCGITMQIHHLISQSVVKKPAIEEMIEDYKYSINNKENLVALPSTLAGACHLEVQLHRGNHTMPIDPDDMDDDSYHKKDYHDYVQELLEKKLNKMDNKCAQQKTFIPQVEIDKASAIILRGISSFRLPLTSCYQEFKPGNNGCGCCESIPELNKQKLQKKACDKNRVHDEFTLFPKQYYKLTVGR